MTVEPVSPLRRRMIDDMSIRQFSPSTQNSYVRAVRDFAAFLGRSPDLAGSEDLRRYQVHMASVGESPAPQIPIALVPPAITSAAGRGSLIRPVYAYGGDCHQSGGPPPRVASGPFSLRDSRDSLFHGLPI